MAFQIHDKHGISIKIDDLNKDIAELWNKPYNPQVGTCPFPIVKGEFGFLLEGEIWAERILRITDKYVCGDWKDVKIALYQFIEAHAHDSETIRFSINYNQPYFDMIDYFVKENYLFYNVDAELET